MSNYVSWAKIPSQASNEINVVSPPISDRVQDFKPLHILPGTEIAAFLPLQVALYFNVCYSPLWFISSVIVLGYKFSRLPAYFMVIILVVQIVVGLVEALRLYLGYEGNLREKVPPLVGFWLLSVLQLLLTVSLFIMGYYGALLLPLEIAVHMVILVFLLVHLVLGFRAMQLMMQAQAVKFHLTQYQCEAEDFPLRPLIFDDSKKLD